MPHCISPQLLKAWAAAFLRDHQAIMLPVRSALWIASGTSTQRLEQCPADSPLNRSSSVARVLQYVWTASGGCNSLFSEPCIARIDMRVDVVSRQFWHLRLK